MLLSVAIRYFYCSRLCIIFVSGAARLSLSLFLSISLPRPVFAETLSSFLLPVFPLLILADPSSRLILISMPRRVGEHYDFSVARLFMFRGYQSAQPGVLRKLPKSSRHLTRAARGRDIRSTFDPLAESMNDGETKATRTRRSRRCAINRNTKRVSVRGRCLEGSSRMRQYFSRGCSRPARAPVSISRPL